MSLLTNLVSYWNLSTDATDAYSTNDGTNIGATFSDTGIIGSCAVFVDGNTNRINIPAFNLNTAGQPWSLSAWFYTSASGGTPPGERILFGKRDGTNTFALALGDSTSTNKMCLYDWGGGTAELKSTAALNDGAKHHIVVTSSGSTQGTMWVDGVSQGSTTAFTFVTQSIANGITIGNFDAVGNTREWAGGINRIGAWGRALDSTDVAALWNSGIGLSYPFQSVIPVIMHQYRQRRN